MTPDEQALAARIKKLLPECDDLRRSPWKGASNPVAGHCYVVAEAFRHLAHDMGSQHWRPMFVRHEGAPHWYLQHEITNEVVDLTVSQFETSVPYSEGRGKGFLTRQPSKRCQVLIARLAV